MFVDAPPKLPEKSGPSSAADPAAFCGLDAGSIEREIGQLAAHIAAASCRWLLLVAEFDRREAYLERGFPCCARWLAWRCSLSVRTAFENVRVARALAGLPGITAAFLEGRLSYSKVRALTRIADPANEADLLTIAEDATAAQLDRILVGYRSAISPDEAEQATARRHFRTSWEPDGTLRFSGNLPAEQGELLLKAIADARESLRRENVADALADVTPGGEEGERAVARRCPMPSKADAVVALAETSLAMETQRERSGGDRNQVVIHVDLDDLRDPATARANGIVGNHAPIALETVRRLACDASIVAIVEAGGEPVSVGRKTRAIPPSIARALRSRDQGCVFPGCGSTWFVDAHHVQHWAAGGETSLGNLIQLCRHHHRLVHEGGFEVEMVGVEPVFTNSAGVVIPKTPPPGRGSWRSVGVCTGGKRSAAGPWTIAPSRRGAPFDRDLTVFALAARRRE